MVLEGVAIGGFHHFGCTGNRALGVTVLIACKGIRGGEPFLQHGINGGAGNGGIGAFIPDDGQRIQGFLGTPPCIRHDGNSGLPHRHHRLDTRHG